MDASNTAQLAAALIRSGLLSPQFEQLRRLEVSSGSRGFVSDLARLFLSDSTGRIERMEEIVSVGGREGILELQRLANQMLGSSDTFGAAGVAGHCKALSEALMDRNECSEFSEMLASIKSELRQLRPLLELYIALDGPEDGSASTSEG